MGCGPSAIPEDLSDAVIDISQVMVTVVAIVLLEKCQNYIYILIDKKEAFYIYQLYIWFFSLIYFYCCLKIIISYI